MTDHDVLFPPSSYAWIITHVNTKDLGDDMADEKGTVGPHDASDEMIADLKAGKGHAFRMSDDDGIWYYRGRIVFVEGEAPVARVITMNPGEKPIAVVCGGLSGDEEADFGPLWDFGTPNAGAVNLQYRVTQTDEDGDTIKVWASL